MTISPKTLDYLKQLSQNNNREWFLDNKEVHDAARENVIEFTRELIVALNKIDPGVDIKTDPKRCVLRIYRDVRFSLDKTPYKSYFGIGKLVSGTTFSGIGYYLHIEPGKSFIAGGYWQPEASHLKSIRQEIDYNAAELKGIVDAVDFKKLFGDFRKQDQLKTIPRDYSADNENIELLKLKSFIAERNIKDEDLFNEDIINNIAAMCAKIYPLNIFLNNAIA